MPPPTGGSDKQVARTAAQHLVGAIRNVSDPQLKATFAQALAALHQYLAQDSREAKAGLAKSAKPAVKDSKPAKKVV